MLPRLVHSTHCPCALARIRGELVRCELVRVMGCVLIAIDFRIPHRMIFHVMLGKVYFKISFMNLFIICLYYIYLYIILTYIFFGISGFCSSTPKKKQCLRRSETPFRSFPDPSTIHNKVPQVPPLNFDLGIFPRLLPPVGVLPVDDFTIKSPSYIEIPHLLSSTIEAKIAGFRNKPHLLCLG